MSTPPPPLNASPASGSAAWSRVAEVGWAFLRLGLTAFGGPVAHLGYFRTEFVERRRWLSDAAYAELVALCQFLPGPASSQVGLAIGLRRAGYAGALVAWLAFTGPSALLMIGFALGLTHLDLHQPWLQGALHGMKLAAVAVIAQAVWGMARSLCPDARRRVLAALVAALALAWPGAAVQLALMLAAGALGAWVWARPAGALAAADTLQRHAEMAGTRVSARAAAGWLALFAALLIGLPLLARTTGEPALALIDVFYRTGALVFGGGHVVLPLLQAEVLPRGWLSDDLLLAGYSAAQAVPGPLFTFAGFVGAARADAPSGWLGGTLALIAIFAPAFLLVVGALPFWERLAHAPRARGAVLALNAAVVGLLLATLIAVLPPSVTGLFDAALAGAALAALLRWRVPPWAVVAACALAGAAARVLAA